MAEDDKFTKIVDAKERYQSKELRIPGVHGMSVGIKRVAGNPAGTIAIIFHVLTKRPVDGVPADERIPKQIEGFPTDVVAHPAPAWGAGSGAEASKATSFPDTKKYRPMQGGCEIYAAQTGTLGCGVKDRKSGVNFVLS